MQNILLVIDMQNDFIDGALGTKEAIAIVPKVKEKIENFKGLVIFTRDTHFENYMDTQEGRNLPVPHCIKNSDGWQIRPKLDQFRTKSTAQTEPGTGEKPITIDKLTFGSSELGPKLQELNKVDPIGSITLIGLCTDICVISNAMIAKTFLPEVPIIVDAACCAGVSPQTHNNALSAMEVCQIKVINKPVSITWLGHSCFRLEKEGYVLIIDPYEDESVPGLSPVREEADACYCSHEHGDHNARNHVQLRNRNIQNPFQVTELPTWHDEVQGAKRGNNTIRIFDDGNVRIAHFGDIGCELTAEQMNSLKGVDVAMIPVGGFYTIDGAQAARLAKQIQAKHVIPMHYRDDQLGTGYSVISTVEEFLREMGEAAVSEAEVSEVSKSETSTFVTDQVVDAKVICLLAENAI